jgi:hypothetical protein
MVTVFNHSLFFQDWLLLLIIFFGINLQRWWSCKEHICYQVYLEVTQKRLKIHVSGLSLYMVSEFCSIAHHGIVHPQIVD